MQFQPSNEPAICSVKLRLMARVLPMAFLLASGAVSAASAPDMFTAAIPAAGVPDGQHLFEVSLNRRLLDDIKPGQSMTLRLPGRGAEEVIFDGRLGTGPAQRWIGHLKSGVQHTVILELGSEGVVGHIRTPKARLELGVANGKQWLTDKGMGQPSASISALPAMLRYGKSGEDMAGAGPAARVAKPAKAAYPVRFDLVRMSALTAGEEVALEVPGKGSYRVVYDGAMSSDRGVSTWVGHLADYGTDFRVLVTSGPEGSVGNVTTPSGEFELTLNDSQEWLIDRSASGLKSFVATRPDELHVTESMLQKHGAKPGTLPTAVAGAATSTGTGTTTATTAAASTATNVIDVLVYYTPGFLQARGTGWRLRIDQLVALANQAYIDSGINMKARLVGTELVNYPDTTTNSAALPLFYGSDKASGFGSVGQTRASRGADLVVLLRPFQYPAQGGTCGVGYVLGSASYAISMYWPYAYSVVSDGTSNGYFCTDYTFAHEMGHNEGSMHDRATVKSQGGGQGAYAYGYGYGVSGSFGTIMSYITPRIGKFSNPKDLTCGGKYACGVSETNTSSSANNALALNNTAPSVAKFMPSVIPDTISLTGVVSVNGAPLAGVTFTAVGSAPAGGSPSCYASGTTGAWGCTMPTEWTGTITPNLPGATFTPASLTYTNQFYSLSYQNFTRN